MPEHIRLGEEGSGRFNPTSYSPAAFLPVQGGTGVWQRCGGWAGRCPAPAATERKVGEAQ